MEGELAPPRRPESASRCRIPTTVIALFYPAPGNHLGGPVPQWSTATAPSRASHGSTKDGSTKEDIVISNMHRTGAPNAVDDVSEEFS